MKRLILDDRIFKLAGEASADIGYSLQEYGNSSMEAKVYLLEERSQTENENGTKCAPIKKEFSMPHKNGRVYMIAIMTGRL